MKLQFTIFILALALSQSSAQLPTHFAPIGTRWEYNYFSYLTEYGKLVYESVGDSVFNGKIHRVIKITSRTSPCDYAGCVFTTRTGNYFYTVQNDSLFTIQNGEYVFLFNFGYRIGDSVSLSSNSRINPKKGAITRIVNAEINNKVLKFWEIAQTCSSVTRPYRTQKVYELIGLTDGTFYNLFDRCPTFDTFWTLCSIKSGDWSYNPEICRYSVATTEVTNMNFAVYPNPLTNVFSIDYSFENALIQGQIIIYDLFGKTVYQQPLNDTNHSIRIDLSGLSTGIYMLSIQSERKNLYSKKLVKTL